MIRDINLAGAGMQKISWANRYMPVLNSLINELNASNPLNGLKLVMTIHLEAKTACLALALKRAGVDVTVTGSNPLSTQDDIAAALVEQGVNVFAWHNCTSQEYETFLHKALDNQPQIIIDDGGDLVSLLHGSRAEVAKNIIGGSEETTTGVHRLKALAKNNQLKFPMIAVNDAYCKYLFDNRYGTGQSALDGIMRTTNLSIASKNVVVAGFGWCGKGVAMRARGLGANVIITEIDPIKAVEAVFDGYTVMPMEKAAAIGDIFITVTGCMDVIRREHFMVMKDGAVLTNAGHFDVEININELANLAKQRFTARNNIESFVLADGRTLNLVAEGRLVNLAAGDGHPIEIMDLSFSMQMLAVIYILEHGRKLSNDVYNLPVELNHRVAGLKLQALGIDIDKLNRKQQDYLAKA